MEEVTSDAVGTAREPELEAEPGDGTALLLSHGKTEQTGSCFSGVSKESGFLSWNLFQVRMLR